jgi:hypothetical protein
VVAGADFARSVVCGCSPRSRCSLKRGGLAQEAAGLVPVLLHPVGFGQLEKKIELLYLRQSRSWRP